MTAIFLVLFAMLIPDTVYGGDVPTELFGVTLGMTTTKTQEQPAGEMPVKRLAGIISWRHGARYYYEPFSESETFPLLVHRQGDEQFYTTNYSSLVLPVIPTHLRTISEWEDYAETHGEQFTVMTVEFTSVKFDSVESAYLVASELCQDLTVDLVREPSHEIDKHDPENNSYSRTCTFAQDNRALSIEQYGPKYVYRLIYSEDYVGAADKAVEDKIKAMRMNVGHADE